MDFKNNKNGEILGVNYQTLQRFSGSKAAVAPLILFFFLTGSNRAFAQIENFEIIKPPEIVRLGCTFNGDFISVYSADMPNAMLGKLLCVSDLNNKKGGCAVINGGQLAIEMSGQCGRADTFVISLGNTDFIYPPVVFRFEGGYKSIHLGENCYNLNCVPRHDPWMPTAADPFPFRKNGYYLNPENGKIKKGGKAFKSGRYTICDLKKWHYVDPWGLYADKQGKKYRGSDLIAKRRIKLKNWDWQSASITALRY